MSVFWYPFERRSRGSTSSQEGWKKGKIFVVELACLHSDWVMMAPWLKLHIECNVLQAGCTKKKLFWNVSLLSRPHRPRSNSQRSPVEVHSFSPLEIPTLLEKHAGPTENIFNLPHPNAPSNPYSSACNEHCLQQFALNTPTKCTCALQYRY